jgi:hydrogenase expression/formation protein HypD
MTAARLNELAVEIRRVCQSMQPVRIMEVCGTHTVSLFRSGLRAILPENVRLVSGPGCPVCVTSQGYIDAACELARRDDVTVCTYGDMVRVPGKSGSLADIRARGAKVRVVHSPLDAVRLAASCPDLNVIFLAVGFETTAPGHAAAVIEARRLGLANLFLLTAQKLVVPAMKALLDTDDTALDAFLCPGHVSVIIGWRPYEPIAEYYGRPCVVAGFEPVQMGQGLLHILNQIAAGHARVENVYPQAVSPEGNNAALDLLFEVFEPGDAIWRAMGTIPRSGLVFRGAYRPFDAVDHFNLDIGPDYDPPGCRCGEVVQGKAEPKDCPLFAKTCMPSRPIGPCMVSGEGTCAAAFKYDRYGT